MNHSKLRATAPAFIPNSNGPSYDIAAAPSNSRKYRSLGEIKPIPDEYKSAIFPKMGLRDAAPNKNLKIISHIPALTSAQLASLYKDNFVPYSDIDFRSSNGFSLGWCFACKKGNNTPRQLCPTYVKCGCDCTNSRPLIIGFCDNCYDDTRRDRWECPTYKKYGRDCMGHRPGDA